MLSSFLYVPANVIVETPGMEELNSDVETCSSSRVFKTKTLRALCHRRAVPRKAGN